MTPDKIIIHHSATKDGPTVSWGAIRRYHIETMGFDAIGYNFGLELINDYYETLVGRSPLIAGAHTIGENERSLGICVVGNYDVDPFTPAIEDALHNLLVWLCIVFKIPSGQIYGHCEFASKTCPGKNLFEWIKKIRERG